MCISQTSFKQEFTKVVYAARAQGKKTLLLINDLDNTPVGLNPIILQERLTKELIQTVIESTDVMKYQSSIYANEITYLSDKDDIILLAYTASPSFLTPTLIDLYVCRLDLDKIVNSIFSVASVRVARGFNPISPMKRRESK